MGGGQIDGWMGEGEGKRDWCMKMTRVFGLPGVYDCSLFFFFFFLNDCSLSFLSIASPPVS